jgi:hypothetical protein
MKSPGLNIRAHLTRICPALKQGISLTHLRLPHRGVFKMLRPVNPEATSAEPAATPAAQPRTFLLQQLGATARTWHLTCHPSHLALADAPDVQPYVILRDEMMKTVTLIEGMRALVFAKPVKVTLKLPPDAAAVVAEWTGKPVLARFYLRRRYGWVLPVAAIWLLGSLPIPGNAANSSVPFDPIGFGLALVLIASWALAKWRPHPALFLVDSLWFLAIGAQLAWQVAHGRNHAWLLLLPFLVWVIVSGVKHFLRFRGTHLSQPPSPP